MSDFDKGVLTGILVYGAISIAWTIAAGLWKCFDGMRLIRRMERKRRQILTHGNAEQIEAVNAECEQLSKKYLK